ncbi:hypothetical protein CFP56_024895 [Quercus suber]|uniref:Universal stress protein n=1 Tax=Quercus suber TaxID=58331 RepID=A0AAW0K656_QUESU
MAFAHYMLAVPVEPSIHPKISALNSSFSHSHSLCFASSSSSRRSKSPNLSILSTFRKIGHKAKSKPQESEAVATTAALAKKYGADITVVVIDERQKESLPEHETQLSSIRWHLSEGGFEEFKLLERLGEGNKSTAIIGEVADDLNLDLVVISMEAIHSKHVDANLLAEFIPCPVVLLPL